MLSSDKHKILTPTFVTKISKLSMLKIKLVILKSMLPVLILENHYSKKFISSFWKMFTLATSLHL